MAASSARCSTVRLNQTRTYGLKVNHLPQGIHKRELEQAFKQFGTIASVHVHDGGSESYAFINYYSQSEAATAAAEMHGKKVAGNRVTVKVQGSKEFLPGFNPCMVKVTFLPKAVGEDELSKIFSFGGKIQIIRKMIYQCDGPFNYAYVKYTSREDAEKAEREIGGRCLYESNIRVKIHGSSSESPKPADVSHQHVTNAPHTQPLLPVAYPVHAAMYAVRPQVIYRPSFSRFHPPVANSIAPHMIPPRAPLGFHFSRPVYPPAAMTPRFFQPRPRLPEPSSQATDGNKSSTVKVSIYGNLSSDDLFDVFSQHGTMKNHPKVLPGEPPFAYINFSCPEEATTARKSLHNTLVRGVRIQVKIDMRRVAAKRECQPLTCEPLVARLLTSKYQEEVETIVKPMQVTMNKMKNGNGIKLWGNPEKLASAKLGVNLILDKVGKAISHDSFSLHCLYIPLFGRREILTAVGEVESRYVVEFLATHNSSGSLEQLPIASFAQNVEKAFCAQEVSANMKLPKINDISDPVTVFSVNKSLSDVWEWEDDEGDYKLYTPDICSKLNRQFAEAPKGSFQFHIPIKTGVRHYSVDFSTMTQQNTRTLTPRRIRRVSAAASWLYKDDKHQFQPYPSDAASEIEQMYNCQQPTMLTINGRQYTFCFTRGDMKQINVITKFERAIKRQPVPPVAATGTYNFLLQVRGLQDCLQSAQDDLKELLEKNVITLTHPLPPSTEQVLQATLLQVTSECFVEATVSSNTVEVKGAPGYVERVKLLINEEVLAHERNLLHAATRISNLPNHWEPQSGKIDLKPVSPGSEEWSEVETLVHETLPSATILRLERIQNLWIWEMYCFSKQRMSKKNSGEVNERKLFHGTSDTPPETILRSEKGFDFRYASKGMWGVGTYFAVDARYSARGYSYPGPRGKQLILAYVLTGETYRSGPNSKLKKPPAKSSGDGDYDSVSGSASGSDIFVIYDHEKAYPAYLITFL